ncbi:MAG: response regulator [Gammaproteobacteria bacterium]|nr:response regulator [Gammaproteobacteria bacterium]
MPQVYDDLLSENRELRARLKEAQEALCAIREGEVDAVIVSGSKGDRVFSLTETENLHRLMVETMNEAGLAVSADGLLLYANDRVARLLQRCRSGLLGRSIEEFVAPADVERLQRLLDTSQAGTADDRVVFVSSSGAAVPMHLWASRLPRTGEAVVCLVGTDLTRLEADQALVAELREHKEALSASRAEALELMSQALVAREQAAQLAQELRESDRRKDAFLATLAHELRNPLAPIRNALEILRLLDSGTAIGVSAREMMDRQFGHLARLVDDLMEVSRITHGKIELRPERVALAAVIENAVELVRPLLQTGGQQLRIELPATGLWIDGDPTRLAQIFSNLLNNAIKYTKADQEIRIVAQVQPDGMVKVSVQDSGKGIPADILPNVFEMFAQGDASSGHQQGGLGIGLTLVQKLVELHGGHVDAFSAGPDQGSEIRVLLPLPLEQGEMHDPSEWRGRTGEDALAVKPRRILVVDDNRDAADSLASLLQLKGADACVAYDGQSALAALEEDPAELVILDIGMPEIDGHEVARRIRARPEWDRVRLIAMTGLGEAAVRQISTEAGFEQHLVKPVPLEVIDKVLAPPSGQRFGLLPSAQRATPSNQPPLAAGSAGTQPGSSATDDRVKPSLIGSLLHDLAQPLSSAGCIAAATKTLVKQSNAESAPVQDALERIEVQVQRASKLVEHLRGALTQAEPEAAADVSVERLESERE